MKIFPAILLSTLVLLTSSAFATERLNAVQSPEALMQRIDVEGGKNVLAKLWTNEKEFENLLNPVESGNVQWFSVWARLRAYSDAGISESIDSAFARALPVVPEEVLKFIGHGLELKNICGSPFIEPEPNVAEQYERNTLAALSLVRDPKLQPLAKECSERVKLNK